ncbi:NifU family protein [archaeon]|nr:NifU family protein [archaeon]
MEKEVRKVIEELKPALQRDGGDIALVSAKDGVVKVKLQGACAGCPMASQTLKYVVEEKLKERVKGFKKLESV